MQTLISLLVVNMVSVVFQPLKFLAQTKILQQTIKVCLDQGTVNLLSLICYCISCVGGRQAPAIVDQAMSTLKSMVSARLSGGKSGGNKQKSSGSGGSGGVSHLFSVLNR